jgi:hypothetical protein
VRLRVCRSGSRQQQRRNRSWPSSYSEPPNLIVTDHLVCNVSSLPQSTPPQSSGEKSPQPQSVDENDTEASATGNNDVFVDVIAANDSGVDEPASSNFQPPDVVMCATISSAAACVVNVDLAAESSSRSSAVAASAADQAVELVSAGNESGRQLTSDDRTRRLTDDDRNVELQQTHVTQSSSTMSNAAVIQSDIESSSQLTDDGRQRCEISAFVAELPAEYNV